MSMALPNEEGRKEDVEAAITDLVQGLGKCLKPDPESMKRKYPAVERSLVVRELKAIKAKAEELGVKLPNALIEKVEKAFTLAV